MTTDIVFLGPSLDVRRAAELLPGAVFLPPVRHGDLLRLDIGPGDRVLIVDGLFMHAAPVRHREILALLERGVIVAGAASMGALRAAELHSYGMRGVGAVFELYRSGVVTGDDEVAVVHGPAEEGYRTLSEPLVDIRVALGDAARAGVIDAAAAERLLAAARDLPFRSRGYRALATVTTDPETSAALERFLAWRELHPVGAKESDARLLLSLAASGDGALRPHGPDDAPIENVRTVFYRSWAARSRGRGDGGQRVTEAETAAALMVLHPLYPRLHRRDVLRRLLGVPVSGPGLEQRVLELARARGLRPDPDAPSDRSWLTEAERAEVAAGGAGAGEATLRLMVRAFGGTAHRGISLDHLPSELAAEPVLARARRVVVTARSLTDRLPRSSVAGAGRMRLRPESVRDCFARVWDCPPEEVEAAAWDRGFADTESFWLAAEPFVLYCRTFGPPDFPDVTASPSTATDVA